MYKIETENVAIYFICYKKGEMDLIETYYDPITKTDNWYFNAYIAYKLWKKHFKNTDYSKLFKMLLTVGASRYIMYVIENHQYQNKNEYHKYMQDLKRIEPIIEKFAQGLVAND